MVAERVKSGYHGRTELRVVTMVAGKGSGYEKLFFFVQETNCICSLIGSWPCMTSLSADSNHRTSGRYYVIPYNTIQL